jgi:acetylornithine deacetylase/succinyl-diaminopimelate desuccinylase family protein
VTAIGRAIDANWPREVEFLRSLVRVPSDNPPGDCAAAAVVAAAGLEALGFTVERHPVPDALVRKNGMISATNLIVRKTFGKGTGPVVALNAHGDVVPPGNGWTVDPYGASERDGALYGRGVAVSKSDFATYAFALLALEESGLPLDGGVELHFTYDEEAGGETGPKWLIDEGLTKANYAISAGFSYAITTAHNGVLHLEVTVTGKQAHAAMPSSGKDALEATVPVLSAIYGERKRLAKIVSAEKGIGSPQITVGLISGGINTNVVPDRIVLRLDRRIIPEEDGTDVEAALIRLIEGSVPKGQGISVECRRIMLAEPLRPLKGIERLVEALGGHASNILGVPVDATGVPLYTDARHYAAAGIPTVLYGAGPRSILEANAHGADEHLQLSDLRAATEIVAETLADLLAPGQSR